MQADVLRKAKENCLIRPKDFKDIKGVRVIIARLVENGQLIKLGRGLYTHPETNFNEQQSLLEAARSVPNGVICLASALRFHNITTQSPYEIWIAIEGSSRKPKIKSIPLRIMRFSGKAFIEGVETHNFDGILLKIYNPSKTVADCFKFRNKIGLDIAIEAL